MEPLLSDQRDERTSSNVDWNWNRFGMGMRRWSRQLFYCSEQQTCVPLPLPPTPPPHQSAVLSSDVVYVSESQAQCYPVCSFNCGVSN